MKEEEIVEGMGLTSKEIQEIIQKSRNLAELALEISDKYLGKRLAEGSSFVMMLASFITGCLILRVEHPEREKLLSNVCKMVLENCEENNKFNKEDFLNREIKDELIQILQDGNVSSMENLKDKLTELKGKILAKVQDEC